MKMAVIIIVLCAGFFVACTMIGFKRYSLVFFRTNGFRQNEFYSFFTLEELERAGYQREEAGFYSGKNKLQGFIFGGANNRGLVIISHGLGSTAESYTSLIMHFVDKGWRVFAFNNTGVAGSEGKGTRGLYQSALDLEAALSYAENAEALKDLPVMLAGHSWGGFAVCAVLNYGHKVNAVVSFAGYNSGIEVLDELGLRSTGGIYHITAPQIRFLQKLLFGDAVKLTAIDGINKSNVPVMIVQCSDDDLIPAASTSIYAHREKITNPHVRIIFRDGENATGHEYVFGSVRQKEYRAQLDESWEKYRAEHKDASQFQWAEEINYDKALANELDPDLMEKIDAFFSSAGKPSL